MRILTVGNMYPPHHLGGYELMWRSSARQLRAAGHRVRVLTTDYATPCPDPAIPEDTEIDRGLRWYWRDHAWPKLSLRERLRLERHNLDLLDRHLDELRPDAIGWWSMGGMSLGMIDRAFARGVPGAGIVVDDWLLYAPIVDQWGRTAALPRRARTLLSSPLTFRSRARFDRELEWVFVSGVVRDHARDAGWKLPAHTVAHGGVDAELFATAPAEPWRGRLLLVGRLEERKGVHVAIAAIARLPGMTLTVIGAGDERYRRRLEQEAAELGVSDRVSFEICDREQLPAAYAAHDAVLFPVQWKEPFGLVPLEAMAVGRPVVATGTGGSGEYLEDGVNCLLYAPPEDPETLAGAVRRLASDPELRQKLRDGGARTAGRLSQDAFNRQVELALGRAVDG